MTKLLVIGTGLIGGSFALAMRRARCFESICGSDTDGVALARAQALGIIDRAVVDVNSATSDADAVMIAVPPGAVAAVVQQVLTSIGRTVPIFDASSVKDSVVAALRAIGPMPAQFVPTHPMAGSERHGPDAADADLFRDRPVILTPQPETDAAVLARVRQWWTAAGANVIECSSRVHDEMVALTSHLPHLVAAAFMDWVARPRSTDPALFSGPGLRDFTRIAASDPALWRQIFAANRTAVLDEFDDWMRALASVGELLRDSRFDELEALLGSARDARARLLDRNHE